MLILFWDLTKDFLDSSFDVFAIWSNLAIFDLWSILLPESEPVILITDSTHLLLMVLHKQPCTAAFALLQRCMCLCCLWFFSLLLIVVFCETKSIIIPYQVHWYDKWMYSANFHDRDKCILFLWGWNKIKYYYLHLQHVYLGQLNFQNLIFYIF